MTRPAAVFAHSRKDLFLVGLSLAYPALAVAGLLVFPVWPWPAMVALGAVMVFLNCTNYQCVAHNFLHNPFFTRPWANAAFSIVNSISLGLPQTLYKYHHLNHHLYNNDLVDPVTRSTRDRSSTYRFGRPPAEESIWSYSLIGPMRTDLVELYAAAKKKGRTRLVWCEAVAMTLYTAAIAAIDWRYLLLFLLPVWFLGQAAALFENFLEHHHAVPGDRLTDSVSCYNALYNFVWFNNGYHQEHHYRPTVHWTDVAALRVEMLPEDQRRVVRGAHWFNFGAPRKPAGQSAVCDSIIPSPAREVAAVVAATEDGCADRSDPSDALLPCLATESADSTGLEPDLVPVGETIDS